VAKTAARSPVGEALHLLGDRWTLLILRDAFRTGYRRYQQWRDELGISDAVLSGRLRDLLDRDVFTLERYEERPPRSEYWLTERGLDLWRILLALWAWESQWVAKSPEAELALRHVDCGDDMVPFLACAACGRSVGLTDVRTVVSESGWRWLATPDPARRRSSRKSRVGDDVVFRRETIDILGDRWSSTLIALAFLGVRRFSDFERNVSVSPAVLSDRLRSLTRLGVLDVVPVSDGGRRKEYRLTPKGLAFFPAVVLVLDWADRWLADDDNRSLEITHLPCGTVLRPGLGCGACGAWLERRAVRFHDAAPAR
jgi:DNA-binding HxlR family transcriptional regulator